MCQFFIIFLNLILPRELEDSCLFQFHVKKGNIETSRWSKKKWT